MRSSHVARSSKALSVFFALTLALGLVPAAALAAPAGDVPADAQTQENMPSNEDGAGVGQSADAGSSEGDASTDVISSEGDEVPEVEKSRPSSEGEGHVQVGEDPNSTVLPTGDMINQDVELDTVVAQAESTRSFFLAQTLESTKTVPMVSAKLPIDTGANDAADAPAGDGPPSSEGEGSEGSEGAPGSDDPVDPSFTLGSSEGDSAAVAAESTVIGSFEYLGMTFAIEPGGESVAVVAADYAKLPTDFLDAQTIVLPSVVSPDGVDYYSVTRIADGAFASLTAAAAAENGQDAGASSDIQAQAEACAYGDQATSEPAEGGDDPQQVISGVVSLSDDPSQHVISSDMAEASDSQAIPTEGDEASSADVVSNEGAEADPTPHVISNEGAEADPTPHVISSGVSEANGVEKSRPSDEGEGGALTDSSAEGAIGITAITIPAFVTTIEDDAFTGFDTLRYVIVSEDNQNYSMYDGCLYDKPLSSLLLIPEGRLGAVRVAPSATTIDPEVFSHCALDAVIADPDSAASQLLSEMELKTSNGDPLRIEPATEGTPQLFDADSYLIELFAVEDASEATSEIQARSVLAADSISSLRKWQSYGSAGWITKDLRGQTTAEVFRSISPGWSNWVGLAIYDPNNKYSISDGGASLLNVGTQMRRRICTRVDNTFTLVQGEWGDMDYTMSWGYAPAAGTYEKINAIPRGQIWHFQPQEYASTRIIEANLVAYKDNVSFNGRTFKFLMLVFPPVQVEYEGTWKDGSTSVSGTWTSRASVANVKSEIYSTGVYDDVNIADDHVDDPNNPGTSIVNDKYWMPIPQKIQPVNYSFVGWNTNATATASATSDWFYKVDGTSDKKSATEYTNLYAIYAKQWTIDFDQVAGTDGQAKFTAYNSTTPLKSSVTKPTRAGYTFNGYYEKKADGTKNFWYDSSGNLVKDAEGKISDDKVSYPLTQDYTLYADWVRDVSLNNNGSSSAVQKVHMTRDSSLSTQAIASGDCGTSPAVHAFGTIDAPTRAGYEFSGYWSTQYDESDSKNQYYTTDATGTVVPVENKTWDIDQDELYAHWRYKVKLDLNTYDTSGQLVKGLGDTFNGSLTGITPSAGQSSVSASSLTVPDGKGNNVSLANGAMFTAIVGAPITLPKVQGRTGYDSAVTWGTTRGANGTAGGSKLSAGTTAADPAVGAPTTYDGGVTLYADWTGRAKKYTVSLVFSHSGLSSTQGTITLTDQIYDQNLSGFTASTLAATKATSDSGTKSYDFKGFYPTAYGAWSPNDAGHALTDAATRATWYIDDEGSAARQLRDTGDGSSVTLYAAWGYPTVGISFDMQDKALTGALGEGEPTDKGKGVYAQDLITNDAMPDIIALVNKHKDARPGFAFNGFWDHPYNEAKNGGTQYYDVVGSCLYNQAGGSTWDKTIGVTLYAHWRYDVVLDLNAYNTDGEAVLNDDASDFAMTVAWPTGVDATAGEFATEQEGWDASGTYATAPVRVQGEDGPASSRELTRYAFTAIDGAPIQLPTLANRDGYTDTRAWGTVAGGCGAASSIMALSDANVTDPFRAFLVLVDDKGTADRSDDAYAYMLHADWRGTNEQLSGAPREYDVKLYATYDNDEANDSFRVKNSALDESVIKVTYDAPIDLSRIAAYKDGNAFNYVDATLDASGASRNLAFKGFYRDKTTIEGAGDSNKRYVYVNDAGDAFSVANAAVKSGTIAFRELPSDGSAGHATIPLYAWWSYNDVSVTFDLQGGTVGGKTAAQLGESELSISAVTSHGPIPSLNDTLKEKPERAGYVFAGWWNTPYNERTDEVVDGVAVTPRMYYGELSDGTVGINAAEGAPDKWLEYTDTTLYAHWKYTIEFATQLPATDIADVSLDAVKATNEQARTAATAPLATGGAGRAATATDKYGNVYTSDTTDRSGFANSDQQTLRVLAIAGAPVQLPSAQNRRALGTGEYERIGYDATWRWHTSSTFDDTDDDEASRTLVRFADEAYRFTRLDDSWSAGFGGEGSVPCKLGRTDFPDANNRLLLYADWTQAAKTFALQLMYSYPYDDYAAADGASGIAYASEHENPLAYVTYDRNDYRYADGSAFTDLASADSTGTTATATFGGQTYSNLDFAGVTTAKNAFMESSEEGIDYPALGERYWNGAGALNAEFAKFRAIRGADVDRYSTDDPFPLYVAWAQPTRELTFNLFDADDVTDATELDELSGRAFSLMKGDAVDKAAVADQLAELASAIKGYEDRTNYVFGGFWSAPAGYEAYEEVAHDATTDKTAKPTCYYVIEDGKLVAAAPSKTDGVEDGWLTSDNASGTWLEDHDVTLYAHWKYAIDFKIDSDDTIPGTAPAASDLLLVGNPTTGYDAATADAIPFADTDAGRAFVDARGMVTFGAPLTLPVNQSSQGENTVVRIRDFGQAPVEYGSDERSATGYAFRAWSLDSGADAAAIAEVDTATGELTVPSALAPQERGRVTLTSQWTALPFEITLNHYPQAMYGGVITSNSVADRGTSVVRIPYDGTFAEAIRPPELRGFDYLGYFTAEGGSITREQKVENAGLQCFLRPGTADPANAGLSLASPSPWFAPNPVITDGEGTAVLYAYYWQQTYPVSFRTWDEHDGTLQEAAGSVEGKQGYQQVWHYGDVLREVANNGHQAAGSARISFPLSSTDTFTRHGYTFDGWYFYPDETPGMTDEELDALHSDKSNRVYLYRVDMSDAAHPVGQGGVFTYNGTSWTMRDDVTTWRTNPLFTVTDRGYALYAGWVPKTYDVTFHANYKNGADPLEVTKTYAYEQLLTSSDLVDPREDGAPFIFNGWNANAGATKATTTGWLFDKSDYAPDKADSTVGAPETGYPIMDMGRGGRFMPCLTSDGSGVEPRAFDLYAIWEKAPDKNIVLFSGNHGTFSESNASKLAAGGATLADDGSHAVIPHEYEVGFDLGLLEDRYGLSHTSDTGWRFLGWVELTPAEVGADPGVNSYAGLDRSYADACDFAESIADATNARDLASADKFFPSAFNVRDRNQTYRDPSGARVNFRDIYLVAAYALVKDYEIVLDLGPAGDVADTFNGVDLGARIESGDDVVFAKKASAPNILYSHSFSVEDADFTVPDAESDMHSFLGWTFDNGTDVEAAGMPWLARDDGGSLRVDIAEYAKWAKAEAHATTLHAKLTPKEYTVAFRTNHPDGTVNAAEDIELRHLGFTDSFTLPYPATRGEGGIFQCWGIVRSGVPSVIGRFEPETEVKLRELLYTVRVGGEYQNTPMAGVMVEDDTITFEGTWLKESQGAVSVKVPLEVCVRVDTATGNVLTADNLELSTNYPVSGSREDVRVVSLRYDRLAKNGGHGDDAAGGYVFDDVEGEVYLSVYVDCQLASEDTGWLFSPDNVNNDGTLKEGATSQSPPLLIDLAHDAVYAERYPYANEGSEGVYGGLYDDAHIGGAESGHGLSDHGFRAFGVTNRLPIRYGLLFKNVAPQEVADLVALGTESDAEIPIAHLYYTIAKAK